MRFVDNISDIGMRNGDEPCYCEYLMYPNDLQLQAKIAGFVGDGLTYLFSARLYDPTGQNQIAIISDHFTRWVADTPKGRMFTARLDTFPPAMCAGTCFVLRIIITTTTGTVVFDKFTDLYCMATCCTIPRNINIGQAEVLYNGQEQVSYEAEVDTYYTTDCGDPLIRISGIYDCLDSDGYYYSTPKSVISNVGTPFPFNPVHVLTGKVKRLPRDITTHLSYNCKIHRTESFVPYRVESFEVIPPWKMDEIERALLSNKITVSDRYSEYDFVFDGGEAFTDIVACWDRYKLDVTLRECTKRVDFSCGEPCGGTYTQYYAIPIEYNGGGYWNDGKQRVAEDDNTLISYLEMQTGVIAVSNITSNYNGYYIVLRVVTTSPMYLPMYLYYDSVSLGHMVYSTTQEPSDIVIPCGSPALGTVSYDNMVCGTPFLATPVYEYIDDIQDVFIVFQNNWESGVLVSPDAFVARREGDIIRIIFMDTINYGYPYNPPAYEAQYFVDEFIGTLSPNARPTADRIIILPNDRTFRVDTLGNLYFTGYPDWLTGTYSAIHIGDHSPNPVMPEVIYQL